MDAMLFMASVTSDVSGFFANSASVNHFVVISPHFATDCGFIEVTLHVVGDILTRLTVIGIDVGAVSILGVSTTALVFAPVLTVAGAPCCSGICSASALLLS